ncbi:MAG: PAAR domain-containing protein [Halopseudomonas sp.]|uniref:PAAR domain-containing protein n=1 Tax=Halopseudomonas sp. TaxID=2901191 RepID=UPI00300379D3
MLKIGIGSKTSTGGVVIEGNSGLDFDGLVASSVGHKATCPACKKGVGEIVAGPEKRHAAGRTRCQGRRLCGLWLSAKFECTAWRGYCQHRLLGGRPGSASRRRDRRRPVTRKIREPTVLELRRKPYRVTR